MPHRPTLSRVQCEELASLADEADATPIWPEKSWNILRQAGVLAWAIPKDYGGTDHGAVDLLEGYQSLASACLTTCFLLSQREAACRRLLDSGQERLCHELLPPLAHGDAFATVGLAQLTTSRQHTGPALRVKETSTALLLDGIIPWVTGAGRADYIVIGAALEDGRQVLAALPTDLPGVRIGQPMDLMALQGSITSEVHCDSVSLDRRWLLAGPAQRVMQGARGGTGGLETSCLALGLANAALQYLESEAVARPELTASAQGLRRQHQELCDQLLRLAQGNGPPDGAIALRGRANSLVLSATQAALTASKGTGYVRPHPAQRWARQALFFLVWSCPWPAAAATLAQLTATPQPPTCT